MHESWWGTDARKLVGYSRTKAGGVLTHESWWATHARAPCACRPLAHARAWVLPAATCPGLPAPHMFEDQGQG